MMIAVFATACTSSGGNGTSAPRTADPGPHITITPATGSRAVRPERPVSVAVTGGRIQKVTVTGKSGAVVGKLSPDGTRWQSRWPLAPTTEYQVTASARDQAGTAATAQSTFTTLRPEHTVDVSAVAPENGERVGVGMPIILGFDRPVRNKADIERALEVRTSMPVEGAWRWDGDQQVIFRPRRYWAKGHKVSVVAHLKGARSARDTYTTRDLRLAFTVGNAVISTVNTKKHRMTVRRDGRVIRRAPISAGKATKRAYTTTNGPHLAMSREYHVVMDSTTVGIPKGHPDYYKLDVYWAVRISNSGEFVHSAPWSLSDQGESNVSHGCVNASAKNATWFYKATRRGDVVIVTGTDRELEWNNGWGYWQLPWSKWVKGSALKRPVIAPQTRLHQHPHAADLRSWLGEPPAR